MFCRFLCSLPENSFVKYVICMEIKMKQIGTETTFSVANNSGFEPNSVFKKGTIESETKIMKIFLHSIQSPSKLK